MIREQDELREIARHAQAQVDYMASKATGGGDTKARLISAAPEMLKALEEIANTFDMTWRPGCIERLAGDIARAAIAKARGTT